MSNYRKLNHGASSNGQWKYNYNFPPYDPSGDVASSCFYESMKSDQRRMIKTGVVLAMSIMIGIGLGVCLERGWTAMNAEVIEVAK